MKFLVDWKKGFGKVPQEFVNFEDFLGESWNLDSYMDHEEIVELLTKVISNKHWRCY
jgi:dsDNA-specific endonuclease/ATPase MutS2